ncbi:unnamed protein product [Microthlaspi erraticum]|uniref:At2g35280-like TPR domain-containing protein n=1 Tax=Microthlaspi erraticum TaxID=1685480 RepID=A0A6D2KSG1_9BRAS|nr:unnamed protein product [Microthlaspi erraticum]CAA7060901.1 unnamed protein product [Microthlaspi erraticum]CAA7060905.1 unnamed protein product [Microthlaspi erraticum]
MGERRPSSRLESLPDELLRDIISRVARSDRTDVRNVMVTSTELSIHAKDREVRKSINLSAFTRFPRWAENFEKLMEKCADGGNVEAHYVKGIREYFLQNNVAVGLNHLKKAADGGYDDGIYLYVILMLCNGETVEGKTYLDKLEWTRNMARGDKCWRNVRRSLEAILVIRKNKYVTMLKASRPRKECKVNDMDTRCEKCYYYKQMKMFVNIRSLYM